ncbi:hypothetical protein Elgi_38030 [Paenibacillus elgii]|uniref:hypothetical protein n=1 Tax=Paenibacillus elgii TaxID=189691 RepID=UPI002D7BB5E1|nr:hypothetical protein Elgi_38030 [Paenibacillus elgii]
MYKMKIHAGADPVGKYLLKAMSDKHEVFKTLDELHHVGRRIKNDSSHRVWYDYEKVEV